MNSRLFIARIGVLSAVFLVCSISVAQAIWQEPTALPPQGNVPKPLNVNTQFTGDVTGTYSALKLIQCTQSGQVMSWNNTTKIWECGSAVGNQSLLQVLTASADASTYAGLIRIGRGAGSGLPEVAANLQMLGGEVRAKYLHATDATGVNTIAGRLEVNGTIGDNFVSVHNENANGKSGLHIGLQYSGNRFNSGTYLYQQGYFGSSNGHTFVLENSDDPNGLFSFRNRTSGGPTTERLRIDTSGIGVTGNINASGTICDSNGCIGQAGGVSGSPNVVPRFGTATTLTNSNILQDPTYGNIVVQASQADLRTVVYAAANNSKAELNLLARNGSANHYVNFANDRGNFFIWMDRGGSKVPLYIEGQTGEVGIGSTDPTQRLEVNGGLRLTPISAPSGASAGTMYFDSALGKFRCWQGTGFVDCVGGSGGSIGTGIENNMPKYGVGGQSLTASIAYDDGQGVIFGGTASAVYPNGSLPRLTVYRPNTENSGADMVLLQRRSTTAAGMSASLVLAEDIGAANNYWAIGKRTTGNDASLSNNLDFAYRNTPSGNPTLKNVLSLRTSGRVGIGTQIPAEQLEITGGAPTRLRITDTTVNPEIQLQYGTGANDHWSWYDSQGDDSLRLWGGGADRLTVTQTGNIGIGTATPGAKLSFGSVTGEKIRLWDNGGSSTGIAQNSGEVQFYSAGDSFSFRNGAYNGAEAFRIQGSTGNIGIGTANPTQKLHVYAVTGDVQALIQTGSANAAQLDLANSGQQWRLANTGAGQLRIVDVTSNNVRLSIEKTTGNVGIGVGSANSATQRLEVNGGLRLTPQAGAPTGASAGTIYYDTSTNKFRCWQGTGFVDCVGGGTGSGSYAAGSNIDATALAANTLAVVANPIFTGTVSLGGTAAINFTPNTPMYLNSNGSIQLRIDADALSGTGTPGANVFSINNGANQSVLSLDEVGNFVIRDATGNNLLRLEGDGDLNIKGQVRTGGADVAEEFETRSALAEGTVVIIGNQGYKSARASELAYDSRVIGVVSDNPAVLIGQIEADHKAVVAMVGVVSVKVSGENGLIRAGDLLVAAGTPGEAMRDSRGQAGTIIGKALEDFSGEHGVIKALINLQ